MTRPVPNWLILPAIAAISAGPLPAASPPSGAAIYASTAEGTAVFLPEGQTPTDEVATVIVLFAFDIPEAALQVRLGGAVDSDASPYGPGRLTAFSVEPVGEESTYGIALFGEVPIVDGAPRPDLDGNGVPERVLACASAETLHMAMIEGDEATPRVVWQGTVQVDYDIEADCSDAALAAFAAASDG